MSTFAAATFAQIVVPKIEKLCLYHGTLIALGDERWAEAHAEIVHFALQRGATCLPDNGDATLDSITDLLLHEVLHAEGLIEHYQAAPAARWRDGPGSVSAG